MFWIKWRMRVSVKDIWHFCSLWKSLFTFALLVAYWVSLSIEKLSELLILDNKYRDYTGFAIVAILSESVGHLDDISGLKISPCHGSSPHSSYIACSLWLCSLAVHARRSSPHSVHQKMLPDYTSQHASHFFYPEAELITIVWNEDWHYNL